jgi:hypothetical protein
MRFLLLMVDGALTRDWPPERGRACYDRMIEWTKAAEARGAAVRLADPLRPDAEGARIRAQGGKPIVTDGPFVETKDVVGGFVMIECGSRQEAIEIAKICPAIEWGMVEVREIWDEPWRGES